MVRTILILGAAALACATQNRALAQSTSLFGSSGSQSSGGSLSDLSSGGNLQGGGGLGSAGGRAGGGADGAFAGPQITEAGAMDAQSVGRGTGFVGQQNQGGFVGQRLSGAGGATGTQPSFGGLGGGRGAGAGNPNGSRQGQSSRRPFRPRYRIGFAYQPAAADVSRRAVAQVRRLKTRSPNLAGMEIVVDEAGAAEIRGQAPNDDARRMIENLVRLEPGIRSVNNLVEVAPAAENP